MRDTVLIIGSHSATRHLINWERDDCEYWTFNEAYSKQFSPDAKESDKWCKRCDVVFQLHDPVIWRNSLNRNDKYHSEWLKSGNTPTIVMQQAYQEVPRAIQYPLDEVVRKFGNISKKFFTSSVSLAIAYAAYMGFKRVEVYGVEMEFGSEYFEQRDAVTFWMGACAGLGCELEVHARFLDFRPIYGYEGKVTINPAEFEQRITELTPMCEEINKVFEGIKVELHKAISEAVLSGEDKNKRILGILQNMVKAASQFGQLDGARQVNEKFLEKSKKSLETIGADYLFVKTEFEQQMKAFGEKRIDAIQTFTGLGQQIDEKYNSIFSTGNRNKRKIRADRLIEQVNGFVKSGSLVGFFTGGQSENQRYAQKLHTLIQAAGGDKSQEAMLGALQPEVAGALA